mgnify:CR=1 FL=1
MCGCGDKHAKVDTCCCGGGLKRRFFTKEEKIAKLDDYIKDLQMEIKAVEAKIQHIKEHK